MRKMANTWSNIACTSKELDLNILLTCGQSFTWRKTSKNIWTNVIEGKIFSVTQTEDKLHWFASTTGHEVPELPLDSAGSKSHRPNVKTEPKTKSELQKCNGKDDPELVGNSNSDADAHQCAVKIESVDIQDDERALRKYFALDIDLTSLYKHWSERDTNFKKISTSFAGVRILQQDPTENLFAFVCSSNNHISRISSMVNKLAENFGNKLGSVGGQDFYSFPTPDRLVGADVESKLRELGFGYRAKFIVKTAAVIHYERPIGWLDSLKCVPYRECIEELMKLCGVGRKVADCVALMSLKKHHVVPVDTHVLQIATRDYRIPGVGKDIKSLTPALHDKISQFFNELYGQYAGWAHTVLFAADLKRFSDRTEASKTRKSKTKPAPQERPVDAKKPKKAGVKDEPQTERPAKRASTRLRGRKN